MNCSPTLRLSGKKGYPESIDKGRPLCDACFQKSYKKIVYLRKRPYFSLHKPQIRTFYTNSSQNANFIGSLSVDKKLHKRSYSSLFCLPLYLEKYSFTNATMRLFFNIRYHTVWGESLILTIENSTFSGNSERHQIRMRYNEHLGDWQTSYTLRGNSCNLRYHYHLESSGKLLSEAGEMRTLLLTESKTKEVYIRDFWRTPEGLNRIMNTKLFTQAFARKAKPVKWQPKRQKLLLSTYAPDVPKDCVVAISGNQQQLGYWNSATPLVMKATPNGMWETEIDLSEIEIPLQFKYCLFHKKNKRIHTWETGINRHLYHFTPTDEKQAILFNDTPFRYPEEWKGAGVAIPVFSLRSREGCGVGEFHDLKALADWCAQTDLKLIQILPINETVASHTWLDSYPYKAISVVALHPMYLHIEDLGSFKTAEDQAQFEALKAELNAKESVDYVRMMEIKSHYYKYFYDLNKATFLKSQRFRRFFNRNKEWLVPYAVFSCLRDRYQTADFRQWDLFRTFDRKSVEAFADPLSQDYDDIAIHYYIQYHLDLQLREAVTYLHRKGIGLKGDLPIGISRNSVDAWIAPELFNLDGQAGAPPDDFSLEGQNWGFPTYRWDVMAQDGYAWWKSRLATMAKYFDAYRIDHILGFFRIWVIPIESTQGLMGYFHPAIPLTRKELYQAGLELDDERFLRPYIRRWYLGNLFGEYTEEVIDTYLDPMEEDAFALKEAYDTQRKITDYFAGKRDDYQVDGKRTRIREGLLTLCTEVLFIRDPHAVGAFHPRITLQYTHSYQALDERQKKVINQIYNDYYYHRHKDFWRNHAMRQLPPLINASQMLVCGEDLGMIPDSVPEVMRKLGILSLEIQRMPKDPSQEFAHPSNYSYYAVASPSTHDMSTIRGWWEENPTKTQRFYHHILGDHGEVPHFCEPWVAKEIIEQHLYAPSILTIFPIQDILAMDGRLRWEKTHEERINIPNNPLHLWRYRMKQSLESLMEADEFNQLLRKMIHDAKRS